MWSQLRSHSPVLLPLSCCSPSFLCAVTTTDVELLKNQVRTEIVRLTATLPNTCHDAPRAPKEAVTAEPKKEQ